MQMGARTAQMGARVVPAMRMPRSIPATSQDATCGMTQGHQQSPTSSGRLISMPSGPVMPRSSASFAP